MARKKSQTWSFDIVVATVIFVGVFLLVFFITSEKVNHPTNKKIFVQQDSIDRVFSIRTNPAYGFLNEQNVVDPAKLLKFAKDGYGSSKKLLGENYEFCVIFEDEEGKIQPIITQDGNYYVGIGSGLVTIKGDGSTTYTCGVVI